MERLRSRRLWVVLAILVGLLLVGRWLDRSQPIQSYRVIDDRTIAVEVDASSPQWTRITGVTETSDRVVVSVGSFIFPWPQPEAGVGTSEELLARHAHARLAKLGSGDVDSGEVNSGRLRPRLRDPGHLPVHRPDQLLGRPFDHADDRWGELDGERSPVGACPGPQLAGDDFALRTMGDQCGVGPTLYV